jgi:hypothetical protein
MIDATAQQLQSLRRRVHFSEAFINFMSAAKPASERNPVGKSGVR